MKVGSELRTLNESKDRLAAAEWWLKDKTAEHQESDSGQHDQSS
jgi:hypothetical protein